MIGEHPPIIDNAEDSIWRGGGHAYIFGAKELDDLKWDSPLPGDFLDLVDRVGDVGALIRMEHRQALLVLFRSFFDTGKKRRGGKILELPDQKIKGCGGKIHLFESMF